MSDAGLFTLLAAWLHAQLGDAGITALLIVALFALLGSGVWIGLALFGVAWIGMELFASRPAGDAMAVTVWGSASSWTLTALPLFVWMGEILFRTKLANDLFNGLAPWTNNLPGRLVHVNVIGCGIFAAVSGSSAATAATVGQMSLPELKRRGYDEAVSIGSLAASGTLGLLIPPSIIMIVYGVSANVSIARLFLAGVLPGIMMMALFMSYIMIWATLNKDKVPPPEPALRFMEKVKRLHLLLPTVLLIIAVIGSIYTGIATATEAATLGVVGSLLVAFFSGSLTWENFKVSLYGATRTSCMIGFIIASASFLSVVMGYAGIPRALASWIGTFNLSAYGLIFALTILFLILGCFLDGISMIVLTTAVIMPMIEAAHIDLIWFGIFIVLVVEIAQITPPVGFNLFVVQGMTHRQITWIARNALPMFWLMSAAVLAIWFFPALVTYLPQQMKVG